MVKPLEAEFGPYRSLFWPVHRHELRKLFPMLLMAFCVCFNYSILRNVKDALVVTTSGADAILFIKVWVMLPMALLFTWGFTWLSRRYSQERVFYIVVTGFLSMYAIFTLFIYPFREELHLHSIEPILMQYLPTGWKGFVLMCRDWTSTLFYVLSELWGSIVLLVLFWGFANEVTKLKEARRFYGVMAIGANLAAIAAGRLGGYFSKWNYVEGFIFGNDAWEQSLFFLVSLVMLSGIVVMYAFYWMNRNVLTDSEYDELHETRREIKIKKKLSMRDSFSYLSTSKYLICIAVMVVAYNLVINLVEVVWKAKLGEICPTPQDVSYYLSTVTMFMGIISTAVAIVLPYILDKLGWTKAALVTPVTLLVTSIGFFSFLIFQDQLSNWSFALVGIGLNVVPIAVAFGAAQNCLSKAAKYSIFDMTQQMAFIPLDHEIKLQGKAAIDGVGSRFGKSGGSIIQQALLFFLGSLSAIIPYIAVIVFFCIGCWVVAVKSLGRQFAALSADELPSDEAVEAEAAPV